MIEISSVLEAEKHLDNVEAVIFDLDDTLYSEKEYVRSGYHKIAEHFGDLSIEEKLWTAFKKGGKPLDEVLSPEKKDEALRIYRFQKPDIHLYSGVSDMLTRIKKNKKIGIITDGRVEGQRAKIEVLGLQNYEIIITDELGGIEYRKPNEAAFRLMQKKMQVPFEKMVYIGDNPNKDFIAPQKLGMKCIYFKNVDGLYCK